MVTLSLMILLTIIAVGLLSLSAVSLRSSSQGMAQAEAKANARLALMIALGELQKEMGPDMRVSASASILDTDENTEEIDGVAEPHWLATYESWGDWLNAPYDVPGKGNMGIASTYVTGRQPMFRKWLVSLPDNQADILDAVRNAPGGNNVAPLVGANSVAASVDYVNAPMVSVVENNQTTGRYAWWVGGENHKARVDKAKRPRSLAMDEWETSQGDTAEIGVGVLTGFDKLDDNQTVGDKLITTQTVRLADVSATDLSTHFHDLTASSRGVLASVRTGQLKKDLSLLFEKGKANLPEAYRFDSGDVREPSIRPMSSEIATRPALTGRHFASWTRMRHFYRMYRQDADALAPASNLSDTAGGGTDGSPGLVWDNGKPIADTNIGSYHEASMNSSVPNWDNEDSYTRFPILTSVTYIISLRDKLVGAGDYRLYCLSTPVYIFWNPYNVDLRMPNRHLWMDLDLLTVQPMVGRIIRDGVPDSRQNLRFSQDRGGVQDGNGAFITFKPGEFRVFTADSVFVTNKLGSLVPGFNALNVGGMEFGLGGNNTTFKISDNPKLGINFMPVTLGLNLYNSQYGNTPGSFVTQMRWSTSDYGASDHTMPIHNHVDWLDASNEQAFAPITPPGSEPGWIFDGQPYFVGYIQLALKSNFSSKDAGWYDSIGWEEDWRCRNWIQAPPFSLGQGLYISDDSTIANTQRIDCAYEFRFGSLLGKDPGDIIPHNPGSNAAYLSIEETVNAVPALELPTAPISSIAGFSGMRIDPGWTALKTINPDWEYKRRKSGNINTTGNTNWYAPTKVHAYQSGMTGPGIGNSFMHPILPRTDVYRYLNNSVASEPQDFKADPGIYPYTYSNYSKTDNKAYCDYWDHVFLLNDALWDDYFVSALADQTRPGASASTSLADNLKKLANGEELANSRYMPYLNGRTANDVKDELDAAEGYLKAAKYLMVDGMFNVNSTSVDAWHALFAGIRERKVVYRDENGALKPVEIPSGKRIALSRFNTATTDQEMTDPEFGIDREDDLKAWSGVRYLDDAQLRKLAEECVKQVKRRGPFLNFSEFINRRLSNDDLGVMGALQSAIDYDDANPESGSINYDFKSLRDFRVEAGDLGNNAYSTPEAAVGSRYAGIPGYVIQSDLLKPIANTLAVRDDTFRIRAYGDSRDKSGNIVAKAWCEAIVQRLPEYADESNAPEVPARTMSADGDFSDIDNSELTPSNRRFGRKFRIESFRWLSASEI